MNATIESPVPAAAGPSAARRRLVRTPAVCLGVEVVSGIVTEVRFDGDDGWLHDDGTPAARGDDAALDRAEDWLLGAVAGGADPGPPPPAAPRHGVGTAFDRAVWRAVATVPRGRVCSYADIARAVERPTAFRAVGAANGRNPIPVIVPCHRIVGASGLLTGFGGGLPLKRVLLASEGIVLDGDRVPRAAFEDRGEA